MQCVCDAVTTQPSSRHAGFGQRDIKQSAEDRKIDSTPDNPNAGSRMTSIPTPLSDDHSRVEPPLPIPNRTVKRSRANDSRHLACESRSSSDSLFRTEPGTTKPP